MVKNFTAQVDDMVTRSVERMEAVARASVQDVIDQAQMPVAKGGKMRVDTGFLRASGQISLTGLPSGPVRGDPEQSYEFRAETVVTALAGFNVGGTIYFGWTANYAGIREIYDGFLGAAVQNWQLIVDMNIRKLPR